MRKILMLISALMFAAMLSLSAQEETTVEEVIEETVEEVDEVVEDTAEEIEEVVEEVEAEEEDSSLGVGIGLEIGTMDLIGVGDNGFGLYFTPSVEFSIGDLGVAFETSLEDVFNADAGDISGYSPSFELGLSYGASKEKLSFDIELCIDPAWELSPSLTFFDQLSVSAPVSWDFADATAYSFGLGLDWGNSFGPVSLGAGVSLDLSPSAWADFMPLSEITAAFGVEVSVFSFTLDVTVDGFDGDVGATLEPCIDFSFDITDATGLSVGVCTELGLGYGGDPAFSLQPYVGVSTGF